MSMIYDTFTFYDEFDLLELRLHVLDGVVDRFVLVEGNKTHMNRDKPLLFSQERDSRFEPFMDKISVIAVTDWPAFTSDWVYEVFQRDAITRGVEKCSGEDIIIISDLDEIPSPEAITAFRPGRGIKALEQYLFQYAYNNLNMTSPYWYHAKIMDYASFKNGLDTVNYTINYNPTPTDGITTPTKIRLYFPPQKKRPLETAAGISVFSWMPKE